jgi:protein-S-isoprenylcysteine O-methyltransferase Ste14
LLQVIAFSGLVLFVLPAIAIGVTGSSWSNPLIRPAWQLSLLFQVLAAPAILGLTAVQEFVTRGGGTPFPFDPPRRLVATGVYSYIRNPMQLSGVLVLLLLGAVLQNVWVSAAGVMAHLYSVGFAGWDENEDLRERFGPAWITYCRNVPRWRPRVRPWRASDEPVARLFVSERCGMCRDVGQWFERRGAIGLLIVPAETHPTGRLTRIRYESADGIYAASGVKAIARALEHIHLGWAMLGFVLRLPIVAQTAQLLADASGAEPRMTPATR